MHIQQESDLEGREFCHSIQATKKIEYRIKERTILSQEILQLYNSSLSDNEQLMSKIKYVINKTTE